MLQRAFTFVLTFNFALLVLNLLSLALASELEFSMFHMRFLAFYSV
jgi:hypothetical protein